MKTVDLVNEEHTLAEVLLLAKCDSVLIHSSTGEDFLLEPADDFDREVAALGGSERFMSFLKERSKEAGGTPLAEVRKRLARQMSKPAGKDRSTR